MLLTVYYLAATSFQSWRLRAIHQRIGRVLDSKNSVVLLKKSDGNKQGQFFICENFLIHLTFSGNYNRVVLTINIDCVKIFIVGMATALASSDICVNSAEATVHDCFWSNDVSQGISISPKQILYINPFISFPNAPSLVPFTYNSNNFPELSKNDVIHALIEADLVPEFNSSHPVLEVIFSTFAIHFVSSRSMQIYSYLLYI